MNEKKPWTKARVMRAYREWAALDSHAHDVVRDYYRMYGDSSDFERLEDTAHPPEHKGADFRYYTWEETGYGDRLSELPMEYLWSDKWRDEVKARVEAARQTAEGQRKEREEKAEFERLKAKFEAAT